MKKIAMFTMGTRGDVQPYIIFWGRTHAGVP